MGLLYQSYQLRSALSEIVSLVWKNQLTRKRVFIFFFKISFLFGKKKKGHNIYELVTAKWALKTSLRSLSSPWSWDFFVRYFQSCNNTLTNQACSGLHWKNIGSFLARTSLRVWSVLWRPRTDIHEGGGTSRKVGWGCVAHFSKPLGYLWPKSAFFATLFMTWPKMR